MTDILLKRLPELLPASAINDADLLLLNQAGYDKSITYLAVKNAILDGALRKANDLSEIRERGATSQDNARQNIGCGTAATKDWGYLSGKLLPYGAYGIGNYTPLPGSPTEGGNTLERMASYTGFYAHKGGYNTQGYGYGMPSELADGEDYAVIAIKASQTPNMVFGLVWADDGLWFDTLDQGMGGRKKWARVFSDRHPPSAAQTGALPIDGGRLTGNIEIYNTAPILQFTESDTGKKYFLVVDGSGIRLDEDSTAGNNNVWAWNSAANTLTVNGQVVPTNYANFDTRYQARGDYTPAGQAYTKAESDSRYQAKGNYTPAGQAYTKAESDARYAQGVQWSAEYTKPYGGGSAVKANAGGAISGLQEDQGDNEIHTYYFKTLQEFVNGAWKNVAG